MRCFYYSFYPESYLNYCSMVNMLSQDSDHGQWIIADSDVLVINMFTTATLTAHENKPRVKILIKHVKSLLVMTPVYGIIFALSILLECANNSRGVVDIVHFIPLMLSVIFPILFRHFVYKVSFCIVDLYFGWNILLTKIPIFYQVLTTRRQSQVSPNQLKNNNSIQIDMYTDAQDDVADKIPKQNSKKLFLVVYILIIILSFAGLVGIFYNNVKDHIKDIIRQNIE